MTKTATDHELITRTAPDYFEGRLDGDVYHEYLHLVRTADGWKVLDALWRPR